MKRLGDVIISVPDVSLPTFPRCAESPLLLALLSFETSVNQRFLKTPIYTSILSVQVLKAAELTSSETVRSVIYGLKMA
jgi:hypothetical protein